MSGTRRQPRHAAGDLPGMAGVRLSGEAADAGVIEGLITDLDGDGFDVISRDAPRRNRREPGIRACLVLRVREMGGTS
ncbi:MAG TPA: hypothetical protein VMV92_20375 [Streptosporangiaceae bacterium]|nr:hypothetical protein [Streptosporangiaceae bacterium]